MNHRRPAGEQSAIGCPIGPTGGDRSGTGAPYHRTVWWGYTLVAVAAFTLGAAATSVRGFRRPIRRQPVGKVSLARPTLAALRVGVLVLDGGDRPVLTNPAAREMGLIRGRPDGGEELHTILRTL